MSSKPGDDPGPSQSEHLSEADRIFLLAMRSLGRRISRGTVGRGFDRRRVRRMGIEALGAARAFLGPSDSRRPGSPVISRRHGDA